MSAGGHPVRRLKSNPATPGNAIVLSIDIRLQALVEQLFGDRRGALVAIDPRNGEILAFVSKPNFDPNLFVDGIDVENWRALNESPDKPLLNRALRGTYPPGSTYKPFMALAALTLGKRTPQQAISDPGYFIFGNHRFRDDKEGGHGVVDMYKSIVHSCDTYYYVLANELGVDAMHDFMAPLGFGRHDRNRPARRGARHAAVDRMEAQGLQEEGSAEVVRRRDDLARHRPGLQHVHDAAARAGAGDRRRPAASAYTPHLVRAVENYETRASRLLSFPPLAPLEWKPEHVAFIHNAYYGVTQEGTSARSFVNAPYKTGGKTGTAQVIEIKANEKYNAAKIDERHRDHALYTAFAPLEEPRVALALIVENAGFGAANAAPIARRVFDYLLSGKYPSEADIAAVQLGQATAPIGVPRAIDAVPLPGATVDGAATARAEPIADACAGAVRLGVAPLTGPRAGRRSAGAAARPRPCGHRGERGLRRARRSGSAPGRSSPATTSRSSSPSRLLALAGLVTMYSAGFDHGTRFADHGRNMALAFVVLFLVAQIPPQQLMQAGDPALRRRPDPAARDGVAGNGHHAQGRDALAQRRHRRSSRARS